MNRLRKPTWADELKEHGGAYPVVLFLSNYHHLWSSAWKAGNCRLLFACGHVIIYNRFIIPKEVRL